MIETQGVVVEVEDDFAYVQTRRESACGSCNSREGCGTASLSTVWGGKPARFKVINGVGAKVGDTVVVGLEERILLKSSLTAYLLPVAGLVLGIAAVLLVAHGAGDIETAAGAGIGLTAGFWGLRWVNTRKANSLECMPVILRWANSWQSISFPKHTNG